MNPRLVATLLIVFLAALTGRLGAAEAKEIPVLKAKPAPSTPDPEVSVIVDRIRAKVVEGRVSEADLAEDIKAFDALITARKTAAPEVASLASFMRAMIWVSVFKDMDKGEALLKQVEKDFPDTPYGKRAAETATAIARGAEMRKLQEKLAIGKTFPDFDEKDLDGKPLSIASRKGKVVLLDFWATWCGPCIAELPSVKAAYDKYQKDGFEIIGISLDSDRDRLTSFLANNEMKWPQYFDGQGWQNKISTKYGISSIPATYLIDGAGNIIARDLRGPALEEAVAKALKK